MDTTKHPHTRQLEIATLAGGALVVAFWLVYYLANDRLGLVATEHVPFEESFVFADAVFALALFAASWSLRHRHAHGPFLLAVAASMSLYLGILDATFCVRNGVLSSLTGGAVAELAVITLCVGGGVYGLRAAWRLWGRR